MSKLYKMPLLLAFYNDGKMKLEIDEDDIYQSFKEFYSHGSNVVDLLKDSSTRNYRDWGKKKYVELARVNPMHFFIRSSPDFFYEAGNKFCLTQELEAFVNNPTFIRHFKDTVDYRARRFYKERLENKLDDIYELIENQKENG